MSVQTTNIAWCESRHPYYYSPYISELSNSLSNIPTLFIAALGIWRTCKLFQKAQANGAVSNSIRHRCLAPDFAIFLVGIGSFVFHSVGTYWSELADEIPMMFLGFSYCVVIKSLYDISGKQVPFSKDLAKKFSSPLSMIQIILLFDVMITLFYIRFNAFIIFQIAFTVNVVIALGMGLKFELDEDGPVARNAMQPSLNSCVEIMMTNFLSMIFKRPVSISLRYFNSVFFIVSGKVIWEIEQYQYRSETCSRNIFSGLYHLHAVWHVLSALSHRNWVDNFVARLALMKVPDVATPPEDMKKVD